MSHIKKYKNEIMIAIGVCSIVLYLFDWINYPSIINIETPSDIKHFMSGGMNGFFDMISKSFNMTMIENGFYRPRLGAFIIQYYDIKLWALLNSIIPLGAHFPMIVLSTFLYVYGFMLWIKGIFKSVPWQVAVGVGGVGLFLPHYISSTFYFLRTAKLIAVGVALCLIGFCFNNMEIVANKNKTVRNCVISFVFFLLCTIDEQVLGVVVILFGLSVINTIIDKKIYENDLIFGLTIFFYFFYYYTWGRVLCKLFTPVPLQEHYHNFARLLGFSAYIKDAIRMYVEALTRVAFDSPVVLIVFFAIYIWSVLLIKNKKQRITSVYFFLSGLIFSLLLITAHPSISELEEQSKASCKIKSVDSR